MNIRVYNADLVTKTMFRAQSLQWTRKFKDYGSFELHVNRSAAADIKENDIISADKDRLTGIVKRIACSDNDVAISGYDLKGLCKQRIDIGGHSGRAGKIITDMAVSALTGGKRAIPNLRVEPSEAGDETVTEDKTDVLASKILQLCDSGELGYEIVKDGGELIFRVLEPRDKSRELIFSPQRKNIYSVDYEDNRLTGGVTFVYNVKTERAENEGDPAPPPTVTEYDTGAEGFERVESYTTESGDEDAVRAAAEKAVADSKNEATVSATVGGTGYRTEFDVGDYVTVSPGVIGGVKIEAVKQITEIKEIYEHGKVTVTPTFGVKPKSIIRRLLEI